MKVLVQIYTIVSGNYKQVFRLPVLQAINSTDDK
jgi:hypothetical protein